MDTTDHTDATGNVAGPDEITPEDWGDLRRALAQKKSKAELRAELERRGHEIRAGATKAELVALLEADDRGESVPAAAADEDLVPIVYHGGTDAVTVPHGRLVAHRDGDPIHVPRSLADELVARGDFHHDAG